MSGTPTDEIIPIESIDPLRSRLRLFLSVDVVSSTAFKQSNQAAFNSDAKIALESRAEPWFSPIAQFYREIERLFAKEWQYYTKVIAPPHGWPVNEAPQLWKSAGDELLYTMVLKDHREALACLSCWIKATGAYRKILRDAFPNLDLKSGAWLAGFPITNTEVIFRSSVGDLPSQFDDEDPIFSNLFLLHEYYKDPTDKYLTRDFIGPSIDTGFRLCSLAAPRKLILSVDLALMIVHGIRGIPAGLQFADMKIFYNGRSALKGVLGGIEYPVFWIDMQSSPDVEIIEDRLLRKSAENTDDIKNFCEAFIREHANKIIIPYIKGNKDGYFDRVPAHHDLRIETLRRFWVNESARRTDETRAFAENADGIEPDEGSVQKLLDSMDGRSGHKN